MISIDSIPPVLMLTDRGGGRDLNCYCIAIVGNTVLFYEINILCLACNVPMHLANCA